MLDSSSIAVERSENLGIVQSSHSLVSQRHHWIDFRRAAGAGRELATKAMLASSLATAAKTQGSRLNDANMPPHSTKQVVRR